MFKSIVGNGVTVTDAEMKWSLLYGIKCNSRFKPFVDKYFEDVTLHA